uniref:Putative secreted protein n=1 Tax=Amblyomma triste TaxID=251400 RepID=A0A023G331_AMBTT
MHFKVVLVGLAIFGFLMLGVLLSTAEAASVAKEAAEAHERSATGTEIAEERIGTACTATLCGGGLG